MKKALSNYRVNTKFYIGGWSPNKFKIFKKSHK